MLVGLSLNLSRVAEMCNYTAEKSFHAVIVPRIKWNIKARALSRLLSSSIAQQVDRHQPSLTGSGSGEAFVAGQFRARDALSVQTGSQPRLLCLFYRNDLGGGSVFRHLTRRSRLLPSPPVKRSYPRQPAVSAGFSFLMYIMDGPPG